MVVVVADRADLTALPAPIVATADRRASSGMIVARVVPVVPVGIVALRAMVPRAAAPGSIVVLAARRAMVVPRAAVASTVAPVVLRVMVVAAAIAATAVASAVVAIVVVIAAASAVAVATAVRRLRPRPTSRWCPRPTVVRAASATVSATVSATIAMTTRRRVAVAGVSPVPSREREKPFEGLVSHERCQAFVRLAHVDLAWVHRVGGGCAA